MSESKMTPKRVLLIKNESVEFFLTKRLNFQNGNYGLSNKDPQTGAFQYLGKKEMYFNKDCDVKVGDLINIEYFDRLSFSNKEVVVTRTYQAESYDDVSIKLSLKHFRVELKE
jgi:hypothetical protein